MKNRFTKILVLSLILMIGILTVSAQESTTLHFMKGIPQSDLQNPALHNDSSLVVIELPGMSGMYFDFSSDFAINDLIHKGTGSLSDSLVLDIDGFHNSLKTTNSIQQNFSMPIIFLGMWSKKSFFSFGITEKEIFQFTFDKSLITFLKDGNAQYMGQNYDLGNLGFDAVHYREYSFGYSNELIKNKLTVGLKVKALYGKFALQTERMNLKIETAADGSYLNLNTDMKINLSLPLTVEYDQNGYFSGMNSNNLTPSGYMMQKGNFGMAFDLGAVYKLTSKITLVGSIVDMGKISFKKDIISLTHVSNFKWEGIDFSKSIDNTKADYVDPNGLFDNEMNKLKDSFKPKKSEFGSDAFDVSIPTKIYLGGTFEVNNKLNVGLLDRMIKNGNISKNTITLSANAKFGNSFSLTGSYSIVNNSYKNLGLGMAFRLGAMQTFFVSDNLLALANPAKSQFVNARFGGSYLFGRKKKPATE